MKRHLDPFKLWVYLLAQVGLGIIGLVYMALAVVATALSVLIIGFPLAYAVAQLGRWLAGRGLALVGWLWSVEGPVKLPATPKQPQWTARAWGVIVHPSTRRSVAWLALNGLLMPVTLVSCLLFPLVLVIGPLHPRLTWWLLLGGASPNGATQASGDPGSPERLLAGVGAGHQTTLSGGGHGLLGMRERVTSLGGSLETGPTAGGGYRVRASLPLTGPTLDV